MKKNVMRVSIDKNGGVVVMILKVNGPFYWVSTSYINDQPYYDNSEKDGSSANHIVDFPKDIQLGEMVDWTFHLRNDMSSNQHYKVEVMFEQDGNRLQDTWSFEDDLQSNEQSNPISGQAYFDF